MSAFPTLKTGAVTQYPAQRGVVFSTVALQFVDGGEQRFRNYPTPLRRWAIQLSLLDQAEMHQLQEFFRNLAGPAGTFSFTDPLDGVSYVNCSLADDSLTGVLASEWNGQTAVTIVENRG